MIIGVISGLVIIVAILVYLFVFKWSVSIPDFMAARHYRFGKPSTDKPISGRRVIVIPSIDQLVMIDQRIQKSTLEGITVLTKERQKMKVSSTLIWKTANAATTIANIKPEDIEPTFFKIIESVIKNECAKMTVDEILENRSMLSKNLSMSLKETTDIWGVLISSVNISNLTVVNENFMKNMAMPKEIEVQKKAELAQIEKELEIELKTIKNNTDSELAKLQSEQFIGEEKERVSTIVENAKKDREILIQEKQSKLEEINSKILVDKEKAVTDSEAEKIKMKLIAEAEGLKERFKAIDEYSENALNYETVKILPELYKNFKMGDVTLFQNDGENNGFDFYSYVQSSMSNFFKKTSDGFKDKNNKIIEDKNNDIIEEKSINI